MKRKIILFRLRSMEMGGVQKALINILKCLNKDKYDIHLLLNLYQGELLNNIPPEIKTHYLVKGKEGFSKNKIMKVCQLVLRRTILGFYYLFPSLMKYKLNIVPDVEIAFMSANLSELIGSPFKRSKKINWFHSDIRFFPKKAAQKAIRLMEECDVTVFVSHTTQKNVETYAGHPIPNGLCIYNLFDYQLIRSKAAEVINNETFKKEGKVFVSVGRMDYAKGYDLLLDAHIELIKEGVEHTIIIVGDGYGRRELKEKIISTKVEETFILAGQKENPYPYIKAADYYIQSSRYEAYPLAIGEATILGKPIISTDVGGVREMIAHKETGYIVNFSKDELKNAIKTFLSEPALIDQLGKNLFNMDFSLHNQNAYQKIENILE